MKNIIKPLTLTSLFHQI